MSYNFLLVSWGTSGNLNPLLTAGRQLIRRGHQVRLMADPAMRDEVVAAGFDFATWHRAPVGRAADPDDFSDMADWFRRAIFGPAGAYAADVRDEVARNGTDAVLSIDLLYGAVLGAEAAGVPAAMLSPHVSLRPLPGVPVASTGLAAPKTLQQRAEVDAANERFADFMNSFRSHLNESCAQLGVAGFDHVMDIYDRPRRLLLAISQAFDFQADWLPVNVRYIGPLLDQPSWSEPWRAPWQAQPHGPRALIACSTGAQGQGELVQRIINAMGLTDIHCVTTAGPNVDVGTLTAPSNVHLVRSAPHNAVMPEVSLVVAQGGHGTVNRALINGLPLLILPMGRDQVDNAARVVAKGAGLQLPATASEAEIAAAATRLISEPHFRLAARRLGAAIKADVDADGLVREMEEVAAMQLDGRVHRIPATATMPLRSRNQRATM